MEDCFRRITYDEGGKVLRDEDLTKISKTDWQLPLPGGSQKIKTVFHFRPSQQSSSSSSRKEKADLVNPLEEDLEDIMLEDASAFFEHAHWQCEMSGKLDLLELFAGSARISQACASTGLRVGQPIDLRTGFDLMTKVGQKKVLEILMFQNPEIVWMAPLCSPWSQWSNMKPEDVRYADREAVMPMVRFCVQVAKYQISKGRKFVIENPEGSAIWFTKVFLDLMKQEGVTYDNLDFCAYGLKDPVATNLYYQKATSLLHNFPADSLSPLFQRCPNRPSGKGRKHEHQPVEGAAPGHGPRSKISQVYPYRFCKTFAEVAHRFLGRRFVDKSTFLLEDILELAFANSEDESLAMLSSLHNSESHQGDVSSCLKTDLHVTNDSIKTLMNHVNALPANTEFDLHGNPGHSWTTKLTPLCLALRQFCFPYHVFDRVTVLRGTLGHAKPASLRSGEVFLVMWKKDQKGKSMQVVMPSLHWEYLETLDFKKYSGVLFKSEGEKAAYTPPQQPQLQKNPFLPSPPSPPSPPPGLTPQQPPATYLPANEPIFVPPFPPSPPENLPQHPIVPPQPSVAPASTGLGGEPSQISQPQLSRPIPTPTPQDAEPVKKDKLKATAKKSKPKPKDKKEDDQDMDQHMPQQPTPPRSPRDRSRSRDRSRRPPKGSRSRDDSPSSSSSEEEEPSRRGRSRRPRDSSRSRDRSERRPPRGSRSRDTPQGSRSRDPSSHRARSPPQGSRSRDSSSHRGRSPPQGSRSRDSSQDSGAPAPNNDANRFYIGSEDEGGEESTRTFDEDVDPDELDEYANDMIIEQDTSDWTYLSEMEKEASNTANFQFVRDMYGNICDLSTYVPSPNAYRTYLASARSCKDKSDVFESYPDITEEDKAMLSLCFDHGSLKVGTSAAKKVKKRKEASHTETRSYAKQFHTAKKDEIQSWIDNEVYELVDIRKLTHQQRRNFVTGRWVLTIKRDKEGNYLKCKARWVLRGFQDKQKNDQQTDSPAASRPGFRLAASAAATNKLDLYHMDLKTAFLQGESYDNTRNIICQLPKEAGHPPHIVALMKKPAYGLNDAPRRWWNVVDAKLRSYGCIPTRADRCTYVLYHDNHGSKQKPKSPLRHDVTIPVNVMQTLDSAIEYLMDPYTGSNSQGRKVSGIICLHVDDLFMAGDAHFEKQVMGNLRKDFQVGSEDKNDIMFVGQRIRWVDHNGRVVDKSASAANLGRNAHIRVDQKVAIEELEEVKFDKSLKDNIECTPMLHTSYRSVLGQINWLQSRTQFHSCYKFSRCASAASSPTIGNCRELNKLVRQIKSQPVTMNFWPLQGTLRLMGIPDASYKNNEDKSSQRAHVIFLTEGRGKTASADLRGTLVDYESHKITVTTQSTTVAELHAFMKCFGTCLFMKGLWADLSGQDVEIHMRTDANNLVTTAKTTHTPEQKETIHLIQMLRKECVSGKIDDLAHVSSGDCLSDCLTKHSAKPDALMKAIETGNLKNLDVHPPFRTLLRHKAFFLGKWICSTLRKPLDVVTLLCEDVYHEVHKEYFASAGI